MHDRIRPLVARERGLRAARGHTATTFPGVPRLSGLEPKRSPGTDLAAEESLLPGAKRSAGTLVPEATKQRMADFSKTKERIARLTAQRDRAIRAKQRPNAMALSKELARERRNLGAMVGAKASPGTTSPAWMTGMGSEAHQRRASTLAVHDMPEGAHPDPAMKFVVGGAHRGVEYAVPFRTRSEADRFVLTEKKRTALERLGKRSTGTTGSDIAAGIRHRTDTGGSKLVDLSDIHAAVSSDHIPGLKDMPLHEIARHISRDWGAQGKGVNFAAKPYLDAMGGMESHKENYGLDSGKSVLAYFLSNASSYRGPKAKAIKAELKRRLRESGEDVLASRLDRLEEAQERLEAAGDNAEIVRARAAVRALREGLTEATLTARARKQIDPSDFVFPKDKRYPIHDRAHASNALARSAGKPEASTVKSKVCARYPDLPACGSD